MMRDNVQAKSKRGKIIVRSYADGKCDLVSWLMVSS
jgi:hypothetical protein